MKGFFIQVTNNLLEPKHRKMMGTSVWEFMWCLDKITKVDDKTVGWVLQGKPVNLADLVKDIGITPQKISKNLSKLQRMGYLILIHTPYGIKIGVNKAKKRFNQKDERFNHKVARFNLKGNPNIRQYKDSNNDITREFKGFERVGQTIKGR